MNVDVAENPTDLLVVGAGPTGIAIAGRRASSSCRMIRMPTVRAAGSRTSTPRTRATPAEGTPMAERELNLREALNKLERELLLEAHRRAGGVRKDAARLLGIDPSNWAYHAKRLGIAKRHSSPAPGVQTPSPQNSGVPPIPPKAKM